MTHGMPKMLAMNLTAETFWETGFLLKWLKELREVEEVCRCAATLLHGVCIRSATIYLLDVISIVQYSFICKDCLERLIL